jgi:hypothetical protein
MSTRTTVRSWLALCLPIGICAGLASAFPGQIESALTRVLPDEAARWASAAVTYLWLPGGFIAFLLSHNAHVDTTEFPYPLVTFFVSGLFWGTVVVGVRGAYRMLRSRAAADRASKGA